MTEGYIQVHATTCTAEWITEANARKLASLQYKDGSIDRTDQSFHHSHAYGHAGVNVAVQGGKRRVP